MRLGLIAVCLAAIALVPASAQQPGRGAVPAGTTLIIETAKGTIDIRLFASEAPKSVEHILALVKRNFYRGQRIHRVTATLAQFGDPISRDVSRRDYWGRGNSGTPIGVLEIPRGRSHQRGAVGLAHGGNPRYADSQIYIMKAASPGLDGQHAVIGQVMRGMEVVDKLAVADVLKLLTVR